MLQRFFLVCNLYGNGILLYTIFPCDTFLCTFSLFSFLQSFIFFCCRNVYSFHLSHLFRRTSLFMEDANFVILNIQILIRSNFSEVSHGRIALLALEKGFFFGFVLKFGKEKWVCLKN